MKKGFIMSAVFTASILYGGVASAASYDQYAATDIDTLWTIAQKAGVSLSSLTAVNPQLDPNNIYQGLMINLPDGHQPINGVTTPKPVSSTTVAASTYSSPEPTVPFDQYIVQDNDTLWSISQKYGVSLSSLVAANPKLDPNNIYGGMKMNLPT